MCTARTKTSQFTRRNLHLDKFYVHKHVPILEYSILLRMETSTQSLSWICCLRWKNWSASQYSEPSSKIPQLAKASYFRTADSLLVVSIFIAVSPDKKNEKRHRERAKWKGIATKWCSNGIVYHESKREFGEYHLKPTVGIVLELPFLKSAWMKHSCTYQLKRI